VNDVLKVLLGVLGGAILVLLLVSLAFLPRFAGHLAGCSLSAATRRARARARCGRPSRRLRTPAASGPAFDQVLSTEWPNLLKAWRSPRSIVAPDEQTPKGC
jgi:hypothetical protein